jgi:hypothetical protein
MAASTIQPYLPIADINPDVSLTGLSIERAGYQEIMQLLVSDPTYLEARAFYLGDHWQDGDAWIGPLLEEDEHAQEVAAVIEHILIPHPGIEEIVNRSRDAIIANEPTWSLVPRRPLEDGERPSEQEQNDIDEAEAILTEWWDDNGALDTLQKVVEDISLGGRGVCRLMVPPGELIEGDDGETFVPEGFIDEQIRRIFPVFAPADSAAVIRDPNTMRQLGIYSYSVRDFTGSERSFIELTFVDSDGQTVVGTIPETFGRSRRVDDPVPFWRQDLGRRLMMWEARSKPIVTRPVIQNQKLANLGCTMMGRNVVLGGFLERIFLNAQAVGHWEEKEDGSGKVFIEDPYKVGAGTTNWIEGKRIGQSPDGQPIVATPSVEFRDPVRTQTFERTIAVAHMNILSAARQVHALITGDATASGESRKQAREDFLKSLTRTKSQMDRLGRWMLETALKLAATFAQNPKRFDAYRIVFACKLDLGPIGSEDRKANLLEVAAEVKPREIAMTEIGCDDTEAWKGIIRSERKEFGPPKVAGDNPATGNPPQENKEPGVSSGKPGDPTGTNAGSA